MDHWYDDLRIVSLMMGASVIIFWTVVGFIFAGRERRTRERGEGR